MRTLPSCVQALDVRLPLCFWKYGVKAIGQLWMGTHFCVCGRNAYGLPDCYNEWSYGNLSCSPLFQKVLR